MTDDKQPPAVFLMGPTASGKTGLAIELCRRFPMDIISVDSALVYRGMDIGTAKPEAEILKTAPHRLIDIRDPAESYSAAEFREDALREMEEISAAGRVPLLAGGTMLYFRALEHGLSRLPSADPEVRQRLEEQAAAIGWQGMHDILAERDPEAAARIHPNDPQRIQRALEVYEITGQSMSELQAASMGEGLGYQVEKIIISPEPRRVLHERIEQRFDQMIEEGFVGEMRALFNRGDLHADLPSMRAVGYRQAWGWLEGQYGFDEMREKAIAATRQLAKRQLTWLRREQAAIWYDLQVEGSKEKIFSLLGGILEGRINRTHVKFHGKSDVNKKTGGTAMSKGQSLQEPFLNALRRERVPVAIYLVNGIKLQGQVESFDQFVVLLKNSVSQMIYKHAISTVVPARNVSVYDEGQG